MLQPSSQAMISQVPTHVLEMWEGLFECDSTKDVELKCQDGSIWAHSFLLAQLSEPLKAMLSNGMIEQQTKQVNMESFSAAQLKFALRLACTGHVDSTEWGNEAKAEAKAKDERRRPARHRGLEGGIFTPQEASSQEASLEEASSQEASSQDFFDALQEASLDYDGQDREGKRGRERGVITAEKVQVPFDVLFESMSFARQYQIKGLFTSVMEHIRSKLSDSNFDMVLKQAVTLDISRLKLTCMDYAKSSAEIKRKFDTSKLSPEVSFELQAIWPMPCSKKRRQSL